MTYRKTTLFESRFSPEVIQNKKPLALRFPQTMHHDVPAHCVLFTYLFLFLISEDIIHEKT